MNKINEYLNKYRKTGTYSNGEPFEMNRPRLWCKDGYSVSVQASRWHYCTPRIDGASEYDSVELGFPNMVDDLIYDYAEDCDDLTKTVYGYVPVYIVNELIEKHGGIDESMIGKRV